MWIEYGSDEMNALSVDKSACTRLGYWLAGSAWRV
jgi:hypothetical protein